MRRGLTMGCNYPGTSSQLAGCRNDAVDWAAVMGERGFAEVVVLLDNDCTRQNMLEAMGKIVADTGPDDLAVIQWSGHGSWQVDRDGDEPDRRDEVICPADYHRAGMITDDDLYRVFTSGHRWARVVFISDSCHSGTVNRLAPALAQPYGKQREGEYTYNGAPGRRAKFLPPAEWMDDDQTEAARRVELAPAKGKPRPSALLLAACSDVEVAYDAWFGGRANGAFTYAALQALTEDPATYRDWQRGINRRLPSVDFDQRPRLEGGSGQRRWIVFEETGER